jgi:CheY-like chemotaxis protein
VLIVDDDEAIRMFVARVLRQPGYVTVTASDGFEAIRTAATEEPFDLLITDLVMPDMMGDQLALRLRDVDATLKVLYLTGNSDLLFEKRPKLSEGEAFLEKPVTIQGMLEAAALLLVGHVPPARAARVRVPGARVRLGSVVGDLRSLSLTGALVHTGMDVRVGSTMPLVLELGTDSVCVTGQVVSSHPCGTQAPEGAGAQPTNAVAFTFIEPSADSRRRLQTVCNQHAEHREPDPAPVGSPAGAVAASITLSDAAAR